MIRHENEKEFFIKEKDELFLSDESGEPSHTFKLISRSEGLGQERKSCDVVICRFNQIEVVYPEQCVQHHFLSCHPCSLLSYSNFNYLFPHTIYHPQIFSVVPNYNIL